MTGREKGIAMATITIRGIDDETKARLRIRAAEHGRSMEAEVRTILREATFGRVPDDKLGTRILQRFAEAGGVELELPERSEIARPALLPE